VICLSDKTWYLHALPTSPSPHNSNTILIIITRSVVAGFGWHGMPPPLMTQVQHFVSRIKKRQRWDVQTMWAYALTFGLGGHGGSSSSTRVPSLKSVGLAVRKICRTMCVSIHGPRDPDLWLFDIETGTRVASKVGNLPSKYGHSTPLGYRITGIHYVHDGRTKAMLIAPSLRERGHNNLTIIIIIIIRFNTPSRQQ